MSGSDGSKSVADRWRTALKIAFGVLSVLFVIAYPLAIYFGLSRFSVRRVAALLLTLLLPGVVIKIWRHRSQAKQFVGLALAATFLIGLAMVFDDQRFMMAYPVIVSAAMLSQFGWTLVRPPSMVERFAGMRVDQLNEAERIYCRGVTVVWCLFFIVNGAIASGLALLEARGAWALYTGLLSYVCMGLIFAVEFSVRKYRFRHHPPINLLDRLAERIFPPRPGERERSENFRRR